MMPFSGFRFEARKLKDYYFELAFPDAEIPQFPLGRQPEAEQVPVFYQGNQPLCVPCSVSWISSFLGKNSLGKSVLGQFYHLVGQMGSYPSKILDKAYRMGVIDNYLYLRDPGNKETIEKALGLSPLMVGLWDWPLVPHQGHVMVLLDKTPEGDWLCVNWQNRGKTDFVTLPPDTEFVLAVSFAKVTNVPRFSFWTALIRKFFP